jgi:hypothetical protein
MTQLIEPVCLLYRYTNLLHQHFSSSVLNSLPEWLRRMDDVGNDGTSMGKYLASPRCDYPDG